MKKLSTLLVVIAALTTASASYAHCECRERPRHGFEHHGEVLLIKEGFGGHQVLREFEYRGWEGKQHAWRRCEHEKHEFPQCRW